MSRARETYTDSGAFVLRTPLLPYETLARLTDLDAILDDPVVREAIFLASPALEERSTDPDARRALLSYVTRMAGRATPFGLFAGCAVGTVGGTTSLTLPPRDEARRHTRLDFGFLAKVVARLTADPEVLPFLTLVPNTSLYRAGARLRMAEGRVDDRGMRYHRVTFEEDEALAETLDRARGGATLQDLATALTDDDIGYEDAVAYVTELVAAQLLVSDLGPVVTGDDSVQRIVRALAAHPATQPYAAALDAADRALDALDEDGLGNDPARYRDVAETLRALDPDLRVDRLFQADLAKPAPGLVLGDDLVGLLYRAVDVLHPLWRGEDEELTTFRERFTDRYEQREVPLAEALDEEVGIGYGPPAALAAEGAPLLDGVVAAGREGRGVPFTSADTHLLALLSRALRDGAHEVVLTAADLAALGSADPPPLPDALAVTATVVADGRVVVDGVGGPNGARVLGRFCHLDPGIEKLVRAHVEAEEAARPDAVFAEVVHLPEGRVGNILARPVLREHEVPFLAVSALPPERQITLDDLLVSVRGSRIVLRSRRLGREVVPRITNAHNHRTGALAVYRFLGAVQYQGVASGPSWTWGPLRGAPFLPRVTHGRLVLARAQWNVTADDLAPLRAAKTVEARRGAIDALRLPRYVVVTAGDNALPLDLATDEGRDLLAHEARRGGLKLVEQYPGPGEQAVSSPEGTFAHELVLPLVRRAASPSARLRESEDDGVESVFAPGSEWLTAKLYTGRATADAVLREVVAPLVADAGVPWFFLRYTDPEHHLRVRFRGDVLPLLHERVRPLLDDGRVWRVQLDTYRREVARYGGPAGIEIAERIFRADSDAVLAILAAAEGDEGLDIRWRAAVAGVDALLADAGVDLPTRRDLVRRWRDMLATEQGGTGDSARRAAGRLLRRERATLEPLLDRASSDPRLAAALRALAARSAVQAPLLAELAAVTPAFHDVLGSLSHMHVNRLLRAAQRTQELVVYDLLDRLYAAAVAKARV